MPMFVDHLLLAEADRDGHFHPWLTKIVIANAVNEDHQHRPGHEEQHDRGERVNHTYQFSARLLPVGSQLNVLPMGFSANAWCANGFNENDHRSQ